ncbi:uridylate kinase [Methylobacterium sp. J-090]|uniref:amino acid kinase family protein n=1 Tax=Methylobacterium sp. J-090 TaxID=2836666 RepID=UPI001FBAF0EC|nr:uridylate kinase [Methylobacterium sp. J-090]MCJ2080068.1 uridylate kinase [Methylobacterium sp. J-090]
MSPELTVVKVGGSLLSDAGRLRAVLTGLAEGRDGPCVVVPGGGPFADAVRTSQAALGFGDALAHRLALDAMGRMAEIFSAFEPRLRIATTWDAASTIFARGGVPVWDPVALKAGHPDIPETWAVTSDSLAVWFATHRGAPRCVLVKSALVPMGAQPEELARLGLVDAAFPAFAARYSGEIVLRGPSDMREAA